MIPESDRIYKHYKGGYYLVLEIAQNTETGEELVIYRRFLGEDGRVYARPLSHWMKPVVTESGEEIPRFVEIDPLAEFGNN